MSATTWKLLSLNVRGISNLRKGKQNLLGVENKRQILFFFKKLTQRLIRKSAGETPWDSLLS